MNAVFLVGILVLSCPAAAQTPQRTTATFGDWTVRCELSEDVRLCEMAGSVTVQGQPAPIAQVAIGPGAEGAYRLVVQVPLNVWLPADPRILVEEREIAVTEFKRCFPQFCLAEADVPAAVMDELSTQSGQAQLHFKEGGQRDVTVPLSLNGIADAYAALKEE